MSLAPGTRLGPYEIQSPLGAGGQGEVYKARDTRLDRTVAIKVLPEHVASDRDLKQRFEREAKTLAALNHPHICHIHDVGSQDGIDYLVMEHLEGETLAQRLMKGALPLDQALQVAIQIADALDKAHRKGIVHRDLKPGNIMLTRGGAGSAGAPQAKLLDFGLAKLRPARAAGGVALSDAPTISSPLGASPGEPLTGQGTILGTFQYMAPEQVEGQEADARTDIFGFGAVVYEMVTGKKAFEGKSQASLIAAILERDPPPISSVQPLSPAVLDRVVKKCLAKSGDERWQSSKDLHDELSWIAEGAAQATVGEARGPMPVARWGRARLAAVAVIALAAFGAGSFVHFPKDPREIRTEISTPSTTGEAHFSLSPDGTQIVFVASGDGPSRLWLRRLDTATARPLPDTDGARFPFWSPDSRSVGFFADNNLKRTDIAGGSPQTLAVVAANYRGGTWAADGTILYSPDDNSPLFRVATSGGTPVAVTRLDGQTSHRYPQFLPDGRRFIYYASGAPETTGIYLGALDRQDSKRLAASDGPGMLASNGWLLFMRGGTLIAQRLDSNSEELTGDPVTVADSVPVGAGRLSVSASGLVAYRTGGFGQQRQLIWFDRSGKTLGTVGLPDASNIELPTLSPDGQRVAVARTVQNNRDIWLLDGTRMTRFTFDPGDDNRAVWSPDGRQIVFDSTRMGRQDLYIKPSNLAGSEQLLFESAQNKSVTDWSRDGRFVAYHSVDSQTAYDLWILPMEGPKNAFAFLRTNFSEVRGVFSPDGRWLAYSSMQSGRPEIYVRSFNGTASGTGSEPGGQWQISASGGVMPRWRADGEELYYIAPDGQLMASPIVLNGASIRPGAPVALFQTQIVGGGAATSFGRQYDVSRDGHFLINTEIDDTTPSPITLIQNWQPGN